ncbi:MAG: enoyl-CoA hydratase/isomerase family protein [Leptospiraceae bacterium]|nr:enoyl-CoA hydratase/isomerase family protein [Leptospiraceae bacterium]
MSSGAEAVVITNLIEQKDGCFTAIIELNRSAQMNALNQQMVQELSVALRSLPDPGSGLRSILLTGAGKAFCVGADLKERASLTPEQVEDFLALMRSVFDTLASMPVPVIAAIPGYCLGGGLELALCCDFRIACSDFEPQDYIGLPETSLGIIPGAGGTQRLPRLIGLSRAKQMIFQAKRISATQALDYGLVDMLAPRAQLDAAARELAAGLAQQAPLALKAAKRAIQAGLSLPLEQALALEQECYRETLGTQDRLEALAAFREKRRPQFKGQ